MSSIDDPKTCREIIDLKDRELDLSHILSIRGVGCERLKYEAKLRDVRERIRVLESHFRTAA